MAPGIPVRKKAKDGTAHKVVAGGQVIQVAAESVADSDGVTFVEVNDLGEVTPLDSSVLGPDISIQFGGRNVSVDDDDDDDTEVGYIIQCPDNYRNEMFDEFQSNLMKRSEKYSDLPVFCNDGVTWTSKFMMAAASPFMKKTLSDINSEDTCLVMPHLKKEEFIMFQDAMFSSSENKLTTLDIFTIIKTCEMVGIDLGMTAVSNVRETVPYVEYASILANPFERKRVYRSLGYLANEVISTSGQNEQLTSAQDMKIKCVSSTMRLFENNVKCEECNVGFYDTDSLDRHKKLLHTGYSIRKLVKQKEKYPCKQCTRSFAFAVNLKKHMWLFHNKAVEKNDNEPCYYEPDGSKKASARAEILKERMEDRKCSMCDKMFANWKQLQTHMLDHNDEMPFKCTICDRGFKEYTRLVRHGVVHTKEKNFECSFCGKKFGLKQNMKVHEKMHSVTPAYACTFCGHCFLTKLLLKRHKKRHVHAKHVRTKNPELRKAQELPELKKLGMKKEVDPLNE